MEKKTQTEEKVHNTEGREINELKWKWDKCKLLWKTIGLFNFGGFILYVIQSDKFYFLL